MKKKEPVKKLAKKQPKKPVDMTTEELLDAVFDPKVARRLREFVRESDDRPKLTDSDGSS